MTDSLFGNRWRALLLVAISVAGIVLTVRAERSSEARGNRFHRAGELEMAADLYAARLAEDSASHRLRYNLGTALLRLGDEHALQELITAGQGEGRLRTSAQYNLGLWYLIQALFSPATDSVLFFAASAVEANKATLRLDPEHADAAWNLALAQLIIVNESPDRSPGNIDQPNGAPDLGEIQIIEGPSPFGQDEGFGDSPSQAEEEALADDDLEPLSLSEASEILGTGHLDPSSMTGKLLLREGRDRRRRGISPQGPPW